VKSSPENHARDSVRLEDSSETELYGITTLQNIFRNVSSIEASQKEVIPMAEPIPTAIQRPLSSNEDGSDLDNNYRSAIIHRRNDLSNVAITCNNHVVESVKPIAAVAAVLHSPNVPSDGIVRSSVISRFGDSSLGTPV
jgi:hypothetical protein